MDCIKKFLDIYWQSGYGWKEERKISDEDFILLKKAGLMFDLPSLLTHDEAMQRLDYLTSTISAQDVAEAFLFSLSTRQLQYRSALSSYYYAIAIPKKHERTVPRYDLGIGCDCCKFSDSHFHNKKLDLGYNILNFEKYRFGGVRLNDPIYCLFDLEQFLKLPKVSATKNDMKLLKQILACTEKIGEKDKAGKLSKAISQSKIIKSNKNEMQILLGILGICGVLSTDKHPCYVENL